MGKIFATMLLHSWFHLTWYTTWLCSEKVEFCHFDSNGWGGGGGGSRQNIWYLAAAFQFPWIWYALWTCSEKVELWPCDPQCQRSVCGKNICYHVAAFVVPFNLISSMNMLWKSWILTFWTRPKVGGQVWGLWAKYLLLCCCICDSL